jgi:inner membrane protein
MDNLTHTLTGFALAESGLKRTTRLGTVTLLLGANLPDLDGLSYVFGSGTAGLAFRRGWTHGVLAMLVLPPLLVGGMLLGARLTRRGQDGVRWHGLMLLAVVGVWSHPLLDLLNTYGVRLLMPFSQRWFYGDALFVVDPWIWIVLAAGVWWSRRRGRAGPARAALALCAGYAILMAAGSRLGEAAVQRRFPGEPASRILAAPVLADPLLRRVIRDLGDRYATGRLTLGATWRYVPDGEQPIGCDTPEAAAAAATAAGAVLLRWARFPFCVSQREGGIIRVRLGDLRYGGRGNSWASVTVPVPAAP